MSNVILSIDDLSFSGWKEVSLTRSLETIADTFSLSLSEKQPGNQHLTPIRPGQSCAIAIDRVDLIAGYIDDVMPFHDKGDHGVTVAGRSKAGDLLECSAASSPGEWHNASLATIVADLIAPFGLSVLVETALGDTFTRFRIEEGETVFEAIDRACGQRAVLPVSKSTGGIALTRPGLERASVALIRGENILRADARYSHRDRHSVYTVKSQQSDDDALPDEQVTRLKGIASDPGIRRHRPLTMIAEQSADAVTIQDRATWERNVRAARGRRATMTVQDWYQQPGGDLWRPNLLVTVQDDWLAIDEDMLIVTASMTRSREDGTTTTLTLMPQGSFDLLAKPASAKKTVEELVWLD